MTDKRFSHLSLSAKRSQQGPGDYNRIFLHNGSIVKETVTKLILQSYNSSSKLQNGLILFLAITNRRVAKGLSVLLVYSPLKVK